MKSSKAGIRVYTQVKFFVKVDKEFGFCFSVNLREFIVVWFVKLFFGVISLIVFMQNYSLYDLWINFLVSELSREYSFHRIVQNFPINHPLYIYSNIFRRIFHSSAPFCVYIFALRNIWFCKVLIAKCTKNPEKICAKSQ